MWWADLSAPQGSEPGFRRPILVIQSDAFNMSRLRTVLAEKPGNVILSRQTTGLPKDSVANMTEIATVDEGFLDQQVGVIPPRLMTQIEAGLRLVLDLQI